MSCRPSNMLGWAVAVLAVGCVAGAGFAQSIPLTPTAQASGAIITHEQGIEFVTVGAPGGVANAPWAGNGLAGDQNIGRGSVGYDYRVGRFEVTTAQWVEFFNAAYGRPESEQLPHLLPPSFWGASTDFSYQGPGRRWAVRAGREMNPVGNISWRMAAMYCNWLHNDKRTDRAAFLSGAYDVGTFGVNALGGLDDQRTRSVGARYFIPSADEWIKAAHWDPNRFGAGQGGYWQYSITSDTRPLPGPPGVRVRADGIPGPDPNGLFAQVNAGWDSGDFPNTGPFAILLGAYANVQSPWGLLDVGGATTEWNERAFLNLDGQLIGRFIDGSPWNTSPGNIGADLIQASGSEFPQVSSFHFGFRIAAAVPAPGPSSLVLAGVLAAFRRRRT